MIGPRRLRILAALPMLLVPAAVPACEQPVSTPPTIDAAEPRFDDPALATLHAALRAAARERAAGWHHLPPRKRGNFLRERWCSPDVPDRACDGGAVVHRQARGTAWFELSTFFFPKDWPRVFGLAWSAGDMPRNGDWGATVSVALEGGRIAGTGLSGRFVHFAGDTVDDIIPFGDTYERKVEEKRFTVSAPGEGEARVTGEIRRLLASPDSLRDTLLARLDALQAEVERGLAAGEARKCRYGPDPGDGTPPPCTLVPLTADETSRAREAAAAEFARQRALLQRDAPALHALVLRVLPEEAWAASGR